MKVQPIGNKVVIKKQEAPKQSAGGILLSATQEKNTLATVIAVGNGVVNENGILVPLTVKAGDTVLLMATSGVPMKVDTEEYHVIAEHEILAIIENQ